MNPYRTKVLNPLRREDTTFAEGNTKTLKAHTNPVGEQDGMKERHNILHKEGTKSIKRKVLSPILEEDINSYERTVMQGTDKTLWNNWTLHPLERRH